MFQASLTRCDFDTDSAMGVSIITDDRSMCTFSIDEEVSEFVGVSKDEMLVLYRRDWLIGTCTYDLQRQENMRLLYVCGY